MENITDHLRQALKDRADNIVNEIASKDTQYKELSKKIKQLEDELNKLLPGNFELFDSYRDAVLEQEALVNEKLYLQGFADGAELKKLFKESIG